MYRRNNKGVVSITAFSLIVLLMFSIFSFTYWFYYDSKFEFEVQIKKQETQNSLNSFRNEVLSLLNERNSTIEYLNIFDSEEITIYLNNKTIIGTQIYGNEFIEVNITSLGIEFCNNYSFSPRLSTSFNFNGSCLLMS